MWLWILKIILLYIIIVFFIYIKMKILQFKLFLILYFYHLNQIFCHNYCLILLTIIIKWKVINIQYSSWTNGEKKRGNEKVNTQLVRHIICAVANCWLLELGSCTLPPFYKVRWERIAIGSPLMIAFAYAFRPSMDLKNWQLKLIKWSICLV